MRMRAAPGKGRGFTLIELLVVVAIIVVMVGLAGAQLMRGPGDVVREESERLALFLRSAARKAILQGGCSPSAPGASPTASCAGAQRPPQGRERGRSVPSPAPAARCRDRGLEDRGRGEAAQDGVVFPAGGELPAFRIVLRSGGARWSVVGAPTGPYARRPSREFAPGAPEASTLVEILVALAVLAIALTRDSFAVWARRSTPPRRCAIALWRAGLAEDRLASSSCAGNGRRST